MMAAGANNAFLTIDLVCFLFEQLKEERIRMAVITIIIIIIVADDGSDGDGSYKRQIE
jgi:hypothetical protein